MQIEKSFINNRLRVSKISSKFRILTTYSFAVIYPRNFLFSEKVVYFLKVSIVFSAYKQNFTSINWHDCTFKKHIEVTAGKCFFSFI